MQRLMRMQWSVPLKEKNMNISYSFSGHAHPHLLIFINIPVWMTKKETWETSHMRAGPEAAEELHKGQHWSTPFRKEQENMNKPAVGQLVAAIYFYDHISYFQFAKHKFSSVKSSFLWNFEWKYNCFCIMSFFSFLAYSETAGQLHWEEALTKQKNSAREQERKQFIQLQLHLSYLFTMDFTLNTWMIRHYTF